MITYWLSFADVEKQANIGVCLVAGDNVEHALRNAISSAKGLEQCLPGRYEVVGVPIPPKYDTKINASWRGRLLTRPECSTLHEFLTGKTDFLTPEEVDELQYAGIAEVARKD